MGRKNFVIAFSMALVIALPVAMGVMYILQTYVLSCVHEE